MAVPVNAHCPIVVTKANWDHAAAGVHANAGDTFSTEKTGPGTLKVRRTDSPNSGWGLNLVFKCTCLGEGIKAPAVSSTWSAGEKISGKPASHSDQCGEMCRDEPSCGEFFFKSEEQRCFLIKQAPPITSTTGAMHGQGESSETMLISEEGAITHGNHSLAYKGPPCGNFLPKTCPHLHQHWIGEELAGGNLDGQAQEQLASQFGGRLPTKEEWTALRAAGLRNPLVHTFVNRVAALNTFVYVAVAGQNGKTLFDKISATSATSPAVSLKDLNHDMASKSSTKKFYNDAKQRELWSMFLCITGEARKHLVRKKMAKATRGEKTEGEDCSYLERYD